MKKITQTLGLVAGTVVTAGCIGVAGYAVADGAIQLPTSAIEVPTPTPPQDVATVVTDTTLTLAVIEGAEYSLDGDIWQDSNIFTGLQPATEYTIYIRIKATEDTPASEVTEVKATTDKSVQVKPVVDMPEVTADTISFAEMAGLEFSINNGATWQDSNIFEGLTPNTQYTILVRLAETATQHASEVVSFELITTKYEQAMPTEQTNSNFCEPTSITVGEVLGAEYSLDGVHYQDSNVFTDLEVNTEYLVYIRYPETDTHYASQPYTVYISTVKYSQSAPAISDAEEVTPNSITMPIIEGVEYSLGGEIYDTDNYFENLQPNTYYDIYARYAEDATHYAGESVLISIQTPKYTQDAPALSILSRTIDTVTVEPVENAVYSIDNGDSWQSENVFNNIEYGINYTILAKLPETSQSYESAITELSYTVESGLYNGSTFESWESLIDSSGNHIIEINGTIFQDIWGTYTNSILVIDNSITEIASNAFQNSSIKGVYMPNSITTLGVNCFQSCKNLTDVVLSNQITTIPSNCFSDCESLNINIPSTITKIESSSFSNTAIENVNISANVQVDFNNYSGSPFGRCKNLQSINVEEGNLYVKSIDGVLYSANGQTLIQFPLARTGDFAVPNSVTTIGCNAFNHSVINSLTLNTNITSIELGAFFDMNNLTVLDIPENVFLSSGTNILCNLPSLSTFVDRTSSMIIYYELTRAPYGGDLSNLQEIYVPDTIVENLKSQLTSANLSTMADKVKPLSEYVAE